jgi:cell division protein YceG involved in septum cleavage
MNKLINDTSKEAEQILIEGYRSMSAAKKLQQVSILTMTVQRMALTRIRAQYGDMSEKIEKVRLAALWIPRETMIKWFNWDPEIQGY